jgi:AbrB family looped-hinge helix DNA binding protein
MTQTHKVGIKGQVVIPKAIRDQIGIEPGDEVTFEPDGQEVRIRRIADDPAARVREIKALRGSWGDSSTGGTDELLRERRKEREAEERKAQRWGVGRSR